MRGIYEKCQLSSFKTEGGVWGDRLHPFMCMHVWQKFTMVKKSYFSSIFSFQAHQSISKLANWSVWLNVTLFALLSGLEMTLQYHLMEFLSWTVWTLMKLECLTFITLSEIMLGKKYHFFIQGPFHISHELKFQRWNKFSL